jgi:hypothetical protein
MFKKWAMAAGLVASCALAAQAGILKSSVTAMRAYFRAGSTLSSSVMTAWGMSQESTQAVTIAASTAGERNCLKYVHGIGTSTGTLRVLDGSTTIYADAAAANAPMGDRFDDSELCGSVNAAMYILYSTAARQATSDQQYLSFASYKY